MRWGRKAEIDDIVDRMKQLSEQLRPVLNCRDLGGIKTENGRTIRSGLLFRSGGLHLFQEEELDVLRKCGIRTILDLRASYAWKKKPDPDIGAVHARYDGNPAPGGDRIDFSAKGFGQTGKHAQAQIETLQDYYTRMPFGYDAFHTMMNELKSGHMPFLFHCSKGKDRTGIAAMILLGALGCDDETILQDYLLSNEYRSEEIRKRLAEGRQNHPNDEGYMKLMFLREGVDEQIGRMVLANLKAKCGSWKNYLSSEYGWTEADLEAFRNRCLM